MKLTVMICTWNRADYLDQALAGMRVLRVPAGLDWELVVVNNNSTDNSDEVIARHSRDLPIRRLFQPKPGKSHAANLGVQHARGELIISTDDDAIVSANWLVEYANAARRFPDASYFGGTVDPWFQTEPPMWIKDHLVLRGPYSVLQLGNDVRPLLPGEPGPYGVNMAIRAHVFREFIFNTRLGPIQNEILPADDGEFIARLKQAGHRGVWVGPATVKHHIAKEPLTRKYIWEWHRDHGRSLVLREGAAHARHLRGIPLWAVRAHCTARLKSWLLYPFKTAGWVR